MKFQSNFKSIFILLFLAILFSSEYFIIKHLVNLYANNITENDFALKVISKNQDISDTIFVIILFASSLFSFTKDNFIKIALEILFFIALFFHFTNIFLDEFQKIFISEVMNFTLIIIIVNIIILGIINFFFKKKI